MKKHVVYISCASSVVFARWMRGAMASAKGTIPARGIESAGPMTRRVIAGYK